MPEQSSFDSLHDTPRVPRTDEAGIPIGAYGLLPNRLYPRPGVASDWMEAVSKANKRIKGELPPIKGSIDDDSPELYRKPVGVPFGKTFAAQGASLDERAVDALRAPKEVGGPTEDEDVDDEPPIRDVQERAEFRPTEGAVPEKPKRRKARKEPARAKGEPELLDGDPCMDTSGYAMQSTPVPEKAASSPTVPHAQPQPQPFMVSPYPPPVQYVEVPKYIEKVVEKPVEKIVEKVVEKPVETAFSEWSKQRVRVTIATPEMQFSVSAIAVTRALFSLVVFLPTTGDSFAFVPKAGTNIKIGYQNKVEDTIFTGVTFDLETLGVLGLCFLVKGDNVPEKMGAGA